MGGGVVFRGEVCESEGEKGGCRRGEEGAAEGGRGRVAAEGEISEAKRGPEGGGNVFEKGCVDYENFPLSEELEGEPADLMPRASEPGVDYLEPIQPSETAQNLLDPPLSLEQARAQHDALHPVPATDPARHDLVPLLHDFQFQPQ